ncbi:MAG TPA: rhomboid family intramembrane serine protease [Candidatus Angelobacter sp.]|nr:rhomboid family intramembrane serine protease [Candidatus Angelobacter sp.]
MVIIPTGHQGLSARRWPIITIALIAINVFVFLLTISGLESGDAGQLSQTRLHIRLLAARHPDLTISGDAQEMVEDFKKNEPEAWAHAQSQTRDVIDAWEARMEFMGENTEKLQQEMDSLAAEYSTRTHESMVTQYGFVPAHPTPLSYITANFLHGGWLHLIGNMWMLWIAGLVLEDKWGRIIYTLFYFAAGAAALQFHAWLNPGSYTPLVGASGAVAGLMGAFLVRFPTMEIKLLWWVGFRIFRFEAKAFWFFPFWLLMEIFSGVLWGSTSAVAHWAHVGGFLFGVAIAFLLRVTRLEHAADKAIEAKLGKDTLKNDAAIVQATEHLEHGRVDDALAILNTYLAARPFSTDALRMVQQVYWRKGDVPAFEETTIRLCGAHLKAREPEIALQEYQEFLNAGGEKLPAPVWFDLCRGLETLQQFDRALTEYQSLAAAYPMERQSVMAQIACGRLCVKKLGLPGDGLKFYETASASKVPHLDLDMEIDVGIREAKAALPQQARAAQAI